MYRYRHNWIGSLRIENGTCTWYKARQLVVIVLVHGTNPDTNHLFFQYEVYQLRVGTWYKPRHLPSFCHHEVYQLFFSKLLCPLLSLMCWYMAQKKSDAIVFLLFCFLLPVVHGVTPRVFPCLCLCWSLFILNKSEQEKKKQTNIKKIKKKTKKLNNCFIIPSLKEKFVSVHDWRSYKDFAPKSNCPNRTF